MEDFDLKIPVFCSKFAKKVEEKLVLTSESVYGAKYLGEKMWNPKAGFIASVDLATKEVSEMEGTLSWLAKESQQNGWIYNLKPFTIYHVKCRKTLADLDTGESLRWTNEYMLVDVVERDLHHAGLEQILEGYKEPVEIVESFGRFSLERRFDWFSGHVNWLGRKGIVSLECDEQKVYTVCKALEIFREIYANLEEWDKGFRRFAAEQLTELACAWDELDDFYDKKNKDSITKDSFARRIFFDELQIHPDGSYIAYYDDDSMFFGHIIIIKGHIKDGMESANIVK